MRAQDTTSSAAVVEVGMPTRGLGRYLQEAIDSVLAQTFTQWRLTVAENGPGDPELAAFLEPYLADARVAHVVRGVDLGMSANHTALVREASAPYVGVLHDDDRWEPEFLARRVDFLEAHPECAFAFGDFATIDEDGVVLARRRPPFAPGVVDPVEFVPAMLHANAIGMPTILVRRSAYREVGEEWASGFPMIDYEMWLRIGARFPVGYLAVEDAAWRFHSRQRSAREQRWGEAWLAFYDIVEERLEGAGVPVDAALLRKRRAAALVCAALDSLERHDGASARSYLARARELQPSAVADPRVITAAVALRLGRRGPLAVTTLRASVKAARRRLGPLLAETRARVGRG